MTDSRYKRAGYLRRKAAGVYLKTTYGFGAATTLAKLASTGGGPVFRKAGRCSLYEITDLDAWAQAKISEPIRSTAEFRRGKKPDIDRADDSEIGDSV